MISGVILVLLPPLRCAATVERERPTSPGRVVKIRIRTTVIEAENGDAIFIPNSLFITNPLVVKRKGKKS